MKLLLFPSTLHAQCRLSCISGILKIHLGPSLSCILLSFPANYFFIIIFLFGVSVAGIWGLVALHLADDLILPFNYLSYASELQVEIFYLCDSVSLRMWKLIWS